jgi:hypothetical protein
MRFRRQNGNPVSNLMVTGGKALFWYYDEVAGEPTATASGSKMCLQPSVTRRNCRRILHTRMKVIVEDGRSANVGVAPHGAPSRMALHAEA